MTVSVRCEGRENETNICILNLYTDWREQIFRTFRQHSQAIFFIAFLLW